MTGLQAPVTETTLVTQTGVDRLPETTIHDGDQRAWALESRGVPMPPLRGFRFFVCRPTAGKSLSAIHVLQPLRKETSAHRFLLPVARLTTMD